MQLKSIKFAPENGDEETIKTISVKMTLKEAIWIAKVAGKQKGTSPHSGIYDCLCGAVFNKFWEDGIDGAARDHHVETPPIRYDQDA